MSTPARTQRRPWRAMAWSRPDAGTTLVELLVSSIVVAVVLVTVGLALLGMLRNAARIDADAIAADQARAVTAAVTRSLSSATLVNPPHRGGPGRLP